ncbi:MAG: MIP/aquaporin family protein [Planctomycetales bacterium]
MNKYLTEFLGTFFLVLTIGLSVLTGPSSGLSMAPLAIGCSLMIMVYMGGHISGAHYNPAVSLAVLLRGKLSSADLVPYLIAQVAGATAAATLVNVILGKTAAIAPGEGVSTLSALLVEVLYTFALALVVLNVATSPKTEGNSYYGLAIGFTVVVAAFSAGSISGGAFNPAVGIGLTVAHALFGGGSWSHLWLYLVGPLAGGALAAVVYKIQHEAA